MNEAQLRDGKANLSAVVHEAVKGEEFLITRYGPPRAVLLAFEEWKRLSAVPSFGRLLTAIANRRLQHQRHAALDQTEMSQVLSTLRRKMSHGY